jgi:hypothetical protein
MVTTTLAKKFAGLVGTRKRLKVRARARSSWRKMRLRMTVGMSLGSRRRLRGVVKVAGGVVKVAASEATG